MSKTFNAQKPIIKTICVDSINYSPLFSYTELSIPFMGLVPSRFSVCAVINGKDLVSFRCIQGRKKNAKRRQFFSLLPKRLCARQTAFPCSFAKISKWRLGTSVPNFVKLMMKRIDKRDELKSLFKSTIASTIYLSFSLPDGSFNLSRRFCPVRAKACIGLLNT